MHLRDVFILTINPVIYSLYHAYTFSLGALEITDCFVPFAKYPFSLPLSFFFLIMSIVKKKKKDEKSNE